MLRGMSNDVIQFISGDELKQLDQEQRAAEVARSPDGMLQAMEEVYEQLGGPEFMLAWAQAEPGEFFKLKAKLALSNKSKQHEHRIYIGLPQTELDK